MALSGKVAIVTGGSKGIGASITRQLTEQGCHVIVTYGSDASAAADIAKTNSQLITTVKSDAGSVADVDTLVKDVVTKHKKVDFVVANAGIMLNLDLESTTEDAFDRSYKTNVKGPYFLCQKAAPHLPEGGRVILFSTTLCVTSSITPNYLLYNSTKGAIEQMTRVMAKDLGRRGITVNCVAPGPTATELFLKGKPESLVKRIAEQNPANRLGKPDEIASVVVGLCGEGMSWINGQVLRANGGMA